MMDTYKALADMAEKKAQREAKLWFPPGKQQDEKARQLADRYLFQHVTPSRHPEAQK